ncbi:hypothetical protein DQ384_39265 [Sphaerisporangium album]|uniref:Uncharacterized protein n=1 Tax=Sphaerisporangium album TaxID=509200 RepID=A0A367EJI4_9ACTN|nr:hypothetical protein [Sphaerisporangium album]RCG18234.1 hypothetical protein DQ384_39265 [Sphaerisporangium album]
MAISMPVRLALAAAGIVAVGAAWTAGRLTAPTAAADAPSAAASSSRPAPSADPPRRGGDAGSPTQQAALAAAANYIAMIGSPQVLEPQRRAQLVQQIGANDYRPQLSERLEHEGASPVLAGLRDDAERHLAYGYRTVPVAVAAQHYDGSQATVEVYTATYVAGSAQPATIGHGTTVADLLFESGGWKLAGYRTTGEVGPMPAGYTTPGEGWRPVNGQSVITITQNLRDLLSRAPAPRYAAP